mgnify:CR=1 FL=1
MEGEPKGRWRTGGEREESREEGGRESSHDRMKYRHSCGKIARVHLVQ